MSIEKLEKILEKSVDNITNMVYDKYIKRKEVNMRYRLESVHLYNEQEEILNEYPQLAKFNIEIVKREIERGYNKIEFRYDVYIEIADLEELSKLMCILDCDLIITKTYDKLKEPLIMIYDGYIE